jgi:hypothetical protein
MISAAIQTIISAIIPNTFMAMGDEEILTPYCVHKETGTPEYVKAGISGYSYMCEVAIIDDTPDKVEALVQSVKDAIIAQASVAFDSVVWEGDEPDFDMESKMYINVLKFTIETSNR